MIELRVLVIIQDLICYYFKFTQNLRLNISGYFLKISYIFVVVVFHFIISYYIGVCYIDWATAKELIDKIRSALRRLEEELPTLYVVHNTIRRILRLVRDEYLSASSLEHTSAAGRVER